MIILIGFSGPSKYDYNPKHLVIDKILSILIYEKSTKQIQKNKITT